MRSLDPRLVRRTRAVRPLLAADVALGAATVVAVVLQATLLATIVARAFEGAALRDLRVELAALVLAFACRGALGWAMEVAGRRAAADVLSELRLALVERRLTTQPTAADGTEAGEIAAAGVQGVGALEAYFARYLPQLVLAAIVPVAVVAWVATVDVESALVMLVTLPLVPVFMWLIGRATEQRTRERWHALRGLSTHFLDVVRGLPTLRALNRSRAEAAALAEAGERYRSATMGTLRVGFLSGSVLELAATLGVALVAVTVGVRLVGGSLGLEAGLTVLVLAPGAVPAAAAARDGVPRERRRARRRRSPARAARRAGGRGTRRAAARPEPGGRGRPARPRLVRVSRPAGARPRRTRPRVRPGRGRGARRRERRREEHGGRAAARPFGADRGPRDRRDDRPGRVRP